MYIDLSREKLEKLYEEDDKFDKISRDYPRYMADAISATKGF